MTNSRDFGLLSINSGACVHAFTPRPRCAACVDACPAEALILDDDSLGIVEDACTGCGLCQSACPQNALTAGGTVPVRSDTALIACKRNALRQSGVKTISCVHSQGVEQLAQLYAKGVRKLIVLSGDCDACDRGATTRFPHHLERFNVLAESRGLAPLRVSSPDLPLAKQWLEGRRTGDKVVEGRRQFLRGVFAPKAILQEGVPETRQRPLSIFQCTFAGSAERALFAAYPMIDPGLCVGCDACIRICPENALFLADDDAGGLEYRSRPDRCSGCGLCVDICEEEAVLLQELGRPSMTSWPLEQSRCRACGVDLHRPTTPDGHDGLCWVCSKQNHHKKLFQVLE